METMIGSSQSSLRFVKLRRRPNTSAGTKKATPTESVSASPTSPQSPLGTTGTPLLALEHNVAVFVDVSHPSRGAVHPPPSEGVLRAVESSERLTGSPKSNTATSPTLHIVPPSPDSPKAAPDTPTTTTGSIKDANETSHRNEPSIVRRVPKMLQLYKVALCDAWVASNKSKGTSGDAPAECPFGVHCSFAHGPHEQRSRLINAQFVRKLRTKGRERASVDPSKYKLRLCEKFMSGGICEYGDNCMYAHGAHALRSVETNAVAEAQLKAMLEAHKSKVGGATSATATQNKRRDPLPKSSKVSVSALSSSCASV
eukprot:PhM_4_TR3308/c0_g1_i1/m.49884